jgi:tetratricopeptide (TPR) repeat protein
MKSISKLKDEARRHEQREEWERAIQAYLQVIRISDEAGEGEVELPLFNRIGDLCVRLGRPHDAVRYYEEAADRYADADLYNNAIALCNKALRYQPDHLELMRKLGQFSASQGFLTDARRYFLEYAERKFKSGEVDAALSALADFAGVVDDGEIRELLGRRLHAYGRNDDALRELRTAYTMYVHTGEVGRAEAVRAAIHGIDPGVSLDEPAAEPVADPFAEAATSYDDLPHFEPLGTSTARPPVAAPPAEPPSAPPAEPPPAPAAFEDLQPMVQPDDEESAVDLPFLDIDDDRPPAYEPPATEQVAGLESSMLDFAADAPDLTELDLGSDVERDTSFAVSPDESEFLLPESPAEAHGDEWEAGADEADVAADDDDTAFDLPLLTDAPPTGYELPLLDDAGSYDESPLPLLDDDSDVDDAPLPLLDDDDEYSAPLPLLEPMSSAPAPAQPSRPAAFDAAAADAGTAFGEPPAAQRAEPAGPPKSAEPAESTEQPSADDMREFDLASFEDDPPSIRMPELDGTPSAPRLDLPPLELPDFDLRGRGTAEPFIFEVEEPAAPEPLFRAEDLTSYGSEDCAAEAAGWVPDDLEIPNWIDHVEAAAGTDSRLTDLPSVFDDLDTGLPGFDEPAGPADASSGGPDEDVVLEMGDTDDDTISFDDEAAHDETVAPTPEREPDGFLPFSFELSDFTIPGAPPARESTPPVTGKALPEWALSEDDEDVDASESYVEESDPTAPSREIADSAAAGPPDAAPPPWDELATAEIAEPPGAGQDAGFAFTGDMEADAGLDDLQIVDAPGQLEWGGRADSELAGQHQAASWAELDASRGDGLGAASDEPVASGAHDVDTPAASYEDVAEAGVDDGWSPDDLMEPEAAVMGQAAVPPSAVDEPTEDEGFVDLGAMLREDEERTTRFYVQETPPTGDEDRDFAELLNQFKAKISEHVPAEDATAHYDLALAYKEMGLFDEAISEFQIALRAGRMRLKIYEELGECFLEKRQFNIAEKILNRALTAQHEDELELLGVYYHLGRAYEEMGRTEQARDAYERVLGMDIGFQDVAERLGRL